jgi:hypothetical protein
MTIWKKEGVQGDLQGVAQKCLGRIANEYEKIGEDFFVTAIRDGNHSNGSFHPIGQAFDFQYAKMWSKAMEARVTQAAGPGFDIVFHKTHVHCEYDPK